MYQQLRIAQKIAVLKKKHKIELKARQLKEFIEIQQQQQQNCFDVKRCCFKNKNNTNKNAWP